MYSVGIDPGWVNLGYAVLDGRSLVETGAINPSLTSLRVTVDSMVDTKWIPDVVSMERYVAYKGIMNAASEHILMIIGGLTYAYSSQGVPVNLFRAIEWKSTLNKYLFRTFDFRNPSTSFDKKFSVAAAKFITGQDIVSDHIADAICLAYYGSIQNVPKKETP